MADSIRIFIASTPSEWLPQRVLEFSILETTNRSVDFHALHTFNRPYALPKDRVNHPRTPFSFQRFLIPEICHYSGQAIYLDADMQVFKSIEALWSVPLNGCSLQTVNTLSAGRRHQFSVMLMDCSALAWDIDEIVHKLDNRDLTYEQLMHEMHVAPSIGFDIPTNWNMLERFDEHTSLLHYTDMNTQPWTSTANPLCKLWVNCLQRAIQAKFITIADVVREIHAGHVRPSLIHQLEKQHDDPLRLSSSELSADSKFIAPYKSLEFVKLKPWALTWRYGKKILSLNSTRIKSLFSKY